MKVFALLVLGFVAVSKIEGVALPLPRNNLFHVIWQMPSGLCQKYETDENGVKIRDMDFKLDSFGIIANPRQRFDGEYSAIFYHFGRFPMYAFGVESDIDNGGVPQRGNMTLHLTDAAEDIKAEIPNPDFGGVAVINQEEWRPNWVKNTFGWKSIYTDKSFEFVEEEHPDWSEEQIEAEAIERFEVATRFYTEKSMEIGQSMRPNGLWGYYAYPYCYNFKVPPQPTCKDHVIESNTKMTWMWQSVSAIMPSIYFFVEYEPEDRGNFLYSQVAEGVRVSKLVVGRPKPVYVYAKMKYNMTLPVFPYRNQDMFGSIRMAVDFGVEGLILWGSDVEFNTPESCKTVQEYTKTVIGPYVKRANQWVKNCSDRNCHSNGRCAHRGAMNFTYKHEIMRGTIEELQDWTISNYKHVCRCLEGWRGEFCEVPDTNVQTILK